jgi:hypothetical protein
VAATSRDLDHLSPLKKDLNQTTSAADNAAVLKEKADLVRMGVRGDIEIFGGLPENEISNAPSHKIGQKPVSMKTVKDFESVFIDPLS